MHRHIILVSNLMSVQKISKVLDIRKQKVLDIRKQVCYTNNIKSNEHQN